MKNARLRIALATLAVAVTSVSFTLVLAMPANAAAPATKITQVQPVGSGLRLASGYKIVKTLHGTSGGACTESGINPADLRCFTTNNGVFDPCWPYRSSPGAALAAVCPNAPGAYKLTKISHIGSVDTEHSKHSYRWAYRLANGRLCALSTGTGDTFHGHPVNIFCNRNAALIGHIDRTHNAWRVRELFSSSTGYRYGPVVRITREYRAASFRALSGSTTAPTEHVCTLTSTGNCIQGGEFCPQAAYGQSGYDAEGRRYVCEGDTTHPHWELP